MDIKSFYNRVVTETEPYWKSHLKEVNESGEQISDQVKQFLLNAEIARCALGILAEVEEQYQVSQNIDQQSLESYHDSEDNYEDDIFSEFCDVVFYAARLAVLIDYYEIPETANPIDSDFFIQACRNYLRPKFSDKNRAKVKELLGTVNYSLMHIEEDKSEDILNVLHSKLAPRWVK